MFLPYHVREKFKSAPEGGGAAKKSVAVNPFGLSLILLLYIDQGMYILAVDTPCSYYLVLIFFFIATIDSKDIYTMRVSNTLE
jgi:hypothetical protein